MACAHGKEIKLFKHLSHVTARADSYRQTWQLSLQTAALGEKEASSSLATYLCQRIRNLNGAGEYQVPLLVLLATALCPFLWSFSFLLHKQNTRSEEGSYFSGGISPSRGKLYAATSKVMLKLFSLAIQTFAYSVLAVCPLNAWMLLKTNLRQYGLTLLSPAVQKQEWT